MRGMGMTGMFSFSDKEMEEAEFQSVMSCFSVNGRWFRDDNTRFERAMRSMTQMPTGRMVMRAILSDVAQKRKADPSYQIEVDMRSKSGETMGTFSADSTDTVVIFPNSVEREISNSIADENILPNSDIAMHAQDQALGICVLHELAHLRQENASLLSALRETKDPILSRYGFVYADAETQALSRQLSLESTNPAIRKMWGISSRERDDYLTKISRQKKDPRSVSISNQARFAQDFIAPLDARVGQTYSSLANRFDYMRMSGCLEELVDRQVAVLSGQSVLPQERADEALRTQLNDRFKSMYGRAFSGNVKFEELLPPTMIDKLAQEVLTERNPPLKAADSRRYQMAVNRFEQSIYLLQETSPEIYDGADEYRDISREQRRVLEEEFGVRLSEKNKQGDLIAKQDPSMINKLRENATSMPLEPQEQVTDLLNNFSRDRLV